MIVGLVANTGRSQPANFRLRLAALRLVSHQIMTALVTVVAASLSALRPILPALGTLNAYNIALSCLCLMDKALIAYPHSALTVAVILRVTQVFNRAQAWCKKAPHPLAKAVLLR